MCTAPSWHHLHIIFNCRKERNPKQGKKKTQNIQVSRGDSQTTQTTILTDSMSLQQKVKNGMGSPDRHVSMYKNPVEKTKPKTTAMDVLPWICQSQGRWSCRQTGRQSIHYKWLVALKIWTTEQFETLPVGTKPRTSYHWSPGGQRCREEVLDKKGQERDTVNQINTGTVSKSTLGKLLI